MVYLSWPVDSGYKKLYKWKKQKYKKKIPTGKHFSKNKGVKGLVAVYISRSGHPSYKKMDLGINCGVFKLARTPQ